MLVRVHSENPLSDVFHARDSDSHRSLTRSLELIAQAGRGVVLYMEPTVAAREALLAIQPGEKPGVPPMGLRDYGIGAQILVALGLRRIRLMTHAPRRVVGLDGYGLEIVEEVHV
jgi:3,4-dihydroxy 2-butanone 4-phosphate synthase/GTP cyclohydrolase II